MNFSKFSVLKNINFQYFSNNRAKRMVHSFKDASADTIKLTIEKHHKTEVVENG